VTQAEEEADPSTSLRFGRDDTSYLWQIFDSGRQAVSTIADGDIADGVEMEEMPDCK
jgi:hypothetical protein